MAKKYEVVKEYILERIKDGTYKPEQALPPERELAASLGVNRVTLRRAVEELMYDGYLIRKKGSGTYLTKEKVRKDDLIQLDEQDNGIHFISAQYHTGGGYGQRMLGIGEEVGYWRIRRSRNMKMIPYAYEDIYLNPKYFPELLHEFYGKGLHDLVQGFTDISHPYRQQQVEALLCLKATADILNVQENSPILQIKTWFYPDEEEKEAVLFCRSYHSGDSYVFRTHRVEIK